MTKKIVRLSVVRNERRRDQGRHIRQLMFDYARNAAVSFGDDISGCVLVTWDRKGSVMTAMKAGYGPFPVSMLPGQVKDALDRHLASNLANEMQTDETSGDLG